MAYEQSLKLFERWCRDEMGIFTVDKVTENVLLYWNLVVIIEVVNDFLYLDGMSFIGIFQKVIQKVEQLQPLVLRPTLPLFTVCHALPSLGFPIDGRETLCTTMTRKCSRCY